MFQSSRKTAIVAARGMRMNPTRSVLRCTITAPIAATLVLGCAISLLAAEPVFAADETSKEVTASYRKAVRAYLDSQGGLGAVGQNAAYGAANETLMVLANSGVEITEEIQQMVLAEATQAYGEKFSDIDFLVDLWAKIYREHFSEKELKEMTAYFQSPVGKKSVELAPTIGQGGMAAIQEVAVGIAPGYQMAVQARLLQAGILEAAPSTP